MSDKRQRALAKRAKRKPARDRQKARDRLEYNRQIRSQNFTSSPQLDDLAVAMSLLLTTKSKSKASR